MYKLYPNSRNFYGLSAIASTPTRNRKVHVSICVLIRSWCWVNVTCLEHWNVEIKIKVPSGMRCFLGLELMVSGVGGDDIDVAVTSEEHSFQHHVELAQLLQSWVIDVFLLLRFDCLLLDINFLLHDSRRLWWHQQAFQLQSGYQSDSRAFQHRSIWFPRRFALFSSSVSCRQS